MFPRQNNTKNQKNRNKRNAGNAIRNKKAVEENLLNIGNDAAVRLDGFPDLLSNEANNAIADPDGSFSHYAANDLNNLVLNTDAAKNEKEIPAEIIKEGLTGYYENDLNNLVLNTDGSNDQKEPPAEIVKEGLAGYYENDLNNLTLNEPKPKQKNKNKRKKRNLINKPIIGKGMGEKDLSDESFDDDPPKELIEPLIREEPEQVLNLINDRLDAGSEKKAVQGAKSSKKSKKPSPAKAAAPQPMDEDLTQVDESMEPAQGWDFASQKLPARKKQGWLSKLGTLAAYYGGKSIGKIFGAIAWLGKSLFGLVTPGAGTLGGTFKRMRGSSKFQPRGNRNNIPGWDGAEFENEAGPEDDVSADFRRVPEIWSWPTAAKAAVGDEEDKNSKPVDPVISVYISQASKEYTATDEGGTGHTGIGIEYSRYSAMSGRWQRYNLRFGYYMGGGGPSVLSKMAVTSYNNATIPGKIMDEKGGSVRYQPQFHRETKTGERCAAGCGELCGKRRI